MPRFDESTESQIEQLLRYPVTTENVIEWLDMVDVTQRSGSYRGRHRDPSES